MLTIIANILPELADYDPATLGPITKSMIYKKFTRKHFTDQARRLMDQETERIPKGYDLETSFYHYSLDLAM